MTNSEITRAAFLICAGIAVSSMIMPIVIGQRMDPGLMYGYGPGYGINATGPQAGYGPGYGMNHG